jgi:hypothetical protein
MLAFIRRAIAPGQAATHSGCGRITARGVDRIRVRQATCGRWFPMLGIMLPGFGRRANACNVTRGRGFRWTCRAVRWSRTTGLVFTQHRSRGTRIVCWPVRLGVVVRVHRTVRILAGRGFRLPPLSTSCSCSGFRMDSEIERDCSGNISTPFCLKTLNTSGSWRMRGFAHPILRTQPSWAHCKGTAPSH